MNISNNIKEQSNMLDIRMVDETISVSKVYSMITGDILGAILLKKVIDTAQKEFEMNENFVVNNFPEKFEMNIEETKKSMFMTNDEWKKAYYRVRTTAKGMFLYISPKEKGVLQIRVDWKKMNSDIDEQIGRLSIEQEEEMDDLRELYLSATLAVHEKEFDNLSDSFANSYMELMIEKKEEV